MAGCALIADLRELELSAADAGSTDSGFSDADSKDADFTDAVAEASPADTGTPCVPDGSSSCSPGVTLYVAPTGDDDAGDGSLTSPFKTITNALAHAGAGVTTVQLANGTYGPTCSAAPCDSTPIVVRNAGPLTVRGASIDQVIVTGPGEAVFVVGTSGVSFEKMTVIPTEIGAPNTVGHGFVFDAGPGSSTPSVTSVSVQLPNAGTLDAGPDAGPGTAIIVGGGVSAKIGPVVVLNGGYRSVDVGGSSSVTLAGVVDNPTIVKGSGLNYECVRVKSDTVEPAAIHVVNETKGDAGAGPAVRITNCTTTIEIDTLSAGTGSTIDATELVAAGSSYGVLVSRAGKATFTNSSKSGSYAGILVTGTANVTFDHFTQIGDYYPLRVYDSATVSLSYFTLKNSVYAGVDCGNSAMLKVRNSTFLANGHSGLNIAGSCTADLGTAADPGNNVFNLTSLKNGAAAICYTSSAGNIAAAGNIWSCGQTAATCATDMTPTRVTAPSDGGAFTCQAAVDIASPSEAQVQALSPTCCN